jgi:magnesium-protoporphyrin IX monomethyl ester (oxidative) cyclase
MVDPSSVPRTNGGEVKYRHALALMPSCGDSARAVKGLFPPTGLEYIAASMQDLVGKVTLLDLRYEERYRDPEVLHRYIRDEVDLLCIGIQWSSGFREICELIRGLPAEVCTVVGGQKATEEVDHLFAHCPNIDMVVRGEGEEIIRQVAAGMPRSEILGLSYRENGGVVHNENQVLPAIADLPYPDRGLRRNEYQLIRDNVRLFRKSFDTVLSTRGCPFTCKFCTFNLNPLGQKRNYTERPVESVLEELEAVTADVVLFSDDNFFTNPKRSEKLLDLILEKGIRKTFVAQTRIDVTRYPELLRKAERAGFRVFLIGIESPHDRILTQLNKGITQQQIRDAFEVFSQFDIYIHGYFIYGNVGETDEEMMYIPEFAKEIGVDSISFQKLRVEKFSPLKDLVDSTPGYYYKRIGGAVYSEGHDRSEMKKIRNRIRAKFYNVPQILRMVRKALRIGLIDYRDLAYLAVKMPAVFGSMVRRRRRRSRASRS